MGNKHHEKVSPAGWVDICDIAILDLKKQIVELKRIKSVLSKDEYNKRRISLNNSIYKYRLKRKKMLALQKARRE